MGDGKIDLTADWDLSIWKANLNSKSDGVWGDYWSVSVGLCES